MVIRHRLAMIHRPKFGAILSTSTTYIPYIPPSSVEAVEVAPEHAPPVHDLPPREAVAPEDDVGIEIVENKTRIPVSRAVTDDYIGYVSAPLTLPSISGVSAWIITASAAMTSDLSVVPDPQDYIDIELDLVDSDGIYNNLFSQTYNAIYGTGPVTTTTQMSWIVPPGNYAVEGWQYVSTANGVLTVTNPLVIARAIPVYLRPLVANPRYGITTNVVATGPTSWSSRVSLDLPPHRADASNQWLVTAYSSFLIQPDGVSSSSIAVNTTSLVTSAGASTDNQVSTIKYTFPDAYNSVDAYAQWVVTDGAYTIIAELGTTDLDDATVPFANVWFTAEPYRKVLSR